MDIKLNIKGLSVIRGQIKVDDIDVGFSCTEGETANCNECSLELLDNPAIQGLIKKFTEEVNFKPAQPQQKTAANNDVEGNRNAQTHDRHEQQAQRAQEMRRQQDEAVMKMLQQIANQLDRLARH